MQKTDLVKRLAFANTIDAPDDWSTVLRRAEALAEPPGIESSHHRSLRVLTAVVVATLFAGAVLWAGVELRNDRSHEPAVTATPALALVDLPEDAIVFSSALGPGLHAPEQLEAVSATGGPVIPLPVLPGTRVSAAMPEWSPDGERLAFVGGPPWHMHSHAGDGDIYVMNADGSGLLQLTDGLTSSQPSWSPDGTHLAFVDSQGTSLVVIDVDGSDRRVIASDRGFYQLPIWSPDGRTIAFRGRPQAGESEASALFSIRTDGTDERQLAIASGGPIAWSPDGSQLAYPSPPNAVWVMEADGSRARRVTTCKLPCVADLDPTWSPDGAQIAFIRQEDGGGAFRLYVVDVATGVKRGLTPDLRFVGSPTWRP